MNGNDFKNRVTSEQSVVTTAVRTERSIRTVRKTNWYVITGGPGSGKTTTVNLLRERGYKTTIEHARHYIDTQRVTGKTVEEIRRNQKEFQLGVLTMQLDEEAGLEPGETVFLDRALPDAMAYYRLLNLEPDAKLLNALTYASYKKVFIMEPLQMVNDYARLEDAVTQKRIHELLVDVYAALEFPLMRVPVMPPHERVNFILNNLDDRNDGS